MKSRTECVCSMFVRSIFRRSEMKVAVAAVAIVLATPAWSQARGDASSELLRSARQSPLFEAEIPATQLRAQGLARIQLGESVYLDLDRYVKQSRLTAQPALKRLLQPSIQQRFLTAKPTYDETILKLQDRIVIERKLTVPIKPGACAAGAAPDAIARLCFKRKPGSIPSGIATDLDKIRVKLAAAPPRRQVKPGVTAAKALRMDDTELLGLLLNSDVRTIRRTSVIPLRANSDISTVSNVGMKNFARQLPPMKPVATQSNRMVAPVSSRFHMMEHARSANVNAAQEVALPNNDDSEQLGDRYFLTGFTLGRDFSDTYEYTFANETFFTDRYYVRVEYTLSLGFGLRMPFSFQTAVLPVSGSSDDRRRVQLSVKPVDVDQQGRPAFPAVGLNENQYFDGDELVLELNAHAGLYISIPGPNVDRDTPQIGFDKSRSIDPVIGTERSHIGDVVLIPASLSGLQIDVQAGGAGVDIGLSADLTNGEIGMDVSESANTQILEGGDRSYRFEDRLAQTFLMKPINSDQAFGFNISNPSYAAMVAIAPFVQPFAYVDVGVYDNHWRMDPLTIDALTISLGFSLDAHAGTTDRYAFSVQPSGSLGPLGPARPTLNETGRAVETSGRTSGTKSKVRDHRGKVRGQKRQVRDHRSKDGKSGGTRGNRID